MYSSVCTLFSEMSSEAYLCAQVYCCLGWYDGIAHSDSHVVANDGLLVHPHLTT